MSELISTQDDHTGIRWKLLTGVSAIALAAQVSSVSAADADKPVVWLSASGQFDQLDDGVAKWTPEFIPGVRTGPLAYQFPGMQRQSRYGYDAIAAFSFQPSGSDWSVSASVQIGRARQPGGVAKTENAHGYGANGNIGYYKTGYHGSAQNNESHLLVDFHAGKDVGIGIFGGNEESTLHAGVRIAQISSRTDVHVKTEVPVSALGQVFNWADTRLSRKFDGVGPSIAWDGSTPIAGTIEDGELAVDWSAAAAVLFGRQTMRQTANATYQAQYKVYRNYFNYRIGVRQQTEFTHARRKSVTVPNLGGSIGISYRWSEARVSLGYRADFFFGAIDGGIGTRKSENRAFFGPYASISIGLGK